MRGPYYAPWRLCPAEVRALDCLCVFAVQDDAAQYLGISPRTFEHQLHAAYNKMGVNRFGGSARTHALRLWLSYHGAIVL